MQCVLFVGLLCLIAVIGVQSDVSSLTISKVSNTLRALLNQETQKIQDLMKDALENRNNSLILTKKLSDITTKLQSIEEKDQAMKEENAQLNRS